MDLNERYPKEVLRYVSGEYSLEDEIFVREWLVEDPDRYEMLEELQKLWKISGGVLELGDERQAWKNVIERIEKEKSAADFHTNSFPKRTDKRGSSTLYMLLRVAVILLVAAGAGAYGFYLVLMSPDPPSHTKQEVVYKTITTKDDERVVVQIKDGTTVTLNSSSQIKYRDDYGVSSRNIYLQGEAYFDVNHNHSAPFIVHAGDAIIEDIGTKFNVNTVKEIEGTEVVVSEGRVGVWPKARYGKIDSINDKSASSVIVSEGQKVSVQNNSDNLIVKKADLYQTLAWLQNRLVFDDEPLEQVIERLESHFDITVEVADSSLFKKYLTGSFRNESVGNVAKVLAISMEAGYSLNDSTLRFFVKQRKLNHFNNN